MPRRIVLEPEESNALIDAARGRDPAPTWNEAREAAVRERLAAYVAEFGDAGGMDPHAIEQDGWARPVAEVFGHASEDLSAALAEIERLRALVDQWERSASMACENPPAGCECPGCVQARETAALEVG